VHAGQSAAVKVDAFEYTKYGTLPGSVSHVSQDAIADEIDSSPSPEAAILGKKGLSSLSPRSETSSV